MLFQSLDQLDSSHLQKLCDDKCPESQSLEFKRELPGNSDKGKHEICKDVAALANTDGGDIVYGIGEKSGSADSIFPISDELHDAAIRRIAQVLDAGIEPRIQGLRIHHVDVKGGYVVVLRVPPSFDGPHCIRNNNNRRFVMRNGTSVTDMSFDQLRSAFDRTATLSERARHFIADRLQLIAEKKLALPLESGPLCVVHLIPIAGLAGRKTVDLRSIYTDTYANFLGQKWGGGSRTFNFDGLLVHPGGCRNNEYYAYNHIFRTGALEGTQLCGITDKDEKHIVWSLNMSEFCYSTIQMFLNSEKKWGFSGPAVLSVAILHVMGYKLGIGGTFSKVSETAADRPHLILPDLWIEDIDSMNLDEAVRPLLDTLWQAFGAERCLDFDETTGAFSLRHI